MLLLNFSIGYQVSENIEDTSDHFFYFNSY